MLRRLKTYRAGIINFNSKLSLRMFLAVAFCSLALALSVSLAPASFSAARAALASSSSMMEITPSSGNTLTDSSGPLTFTGGPYVVANPSSQVDGIPICNQALPCDEYTFNVSVSATTSQTKYVRIQIDWPVVGEAQFDLYVFDGTTASGKLIAKSLGNQTYVAPDVALIPAVPASNGIYTLRIVPFLPFGQSITGTISLVDIPTAAPVDPGVAPSFSNHVSPGNLGNNAGEPSIGIDWAPRVASLRNDADRVNTGGVAFFQSGPNTLRVNFDDRTSPSTATWEDKSAPTVKQFVLSDPIGFVDRQTGRVFSLDLLGGEGNSLAAFSDDDGNSWTPMQGGGAPAGPDHETLGGGPFNEAALPPPPPHPLYQNAVYYCSQNIVGGAECSRSDDGGLTFGPGVDIFTPTQCYGGIHGHVKVAPDGTVYVPNSSCTSGNGGSQGMAVSRDNGLTWHDSTVPTSTGSGDPSVGIDADNNVFIGYVNADGRPHIAVSTNHGDSWSKDYDVGVPVGCNAAADPNPAYAPCRIKSAVFPVVVAGDKDRAAFGFLGSTTGGNYQDQATYQGIWYFYVATTYDGGNTWSTVNATPGDPVQKGSICLGGLTCGTDRNLLDFNDMTIDGEGRVLAAYADGCVASAQCVAPDYNGRLKKAAIVRQADGRRMFAAFDPSGTPTPTPTPTPIPEPFNVLHFHGNSSDDPGFTGTGQTDLELNGGPFLVNRSTLGTGTPAHWDTPPAPAAINGTGDQNIYDPNWIWRLDAPTTLVGDMKIKWWASCGACGAGLSADWNIRLWADGTKVFETRVQSVTPDLPNVPKLLEATVKLPSVTANSKFVLHVDPVYVDSQVNTHIYYDSQSPCPGAAGDAPCDSQVIMPIYDPNATPTPTASPTPTPPPPGAATPRFQNYTSPATNIFNGGEPSIGANWLTGNAMYLASFSAVRIGFDDCSSPARDTWTDTNVPAAVSLDPIMFTDHMRTAGDNTPNRTLVSQLTGQDSTTFVTDDDGRTYSPSQGGGIPSGVDHQTIGGGPYNNNAVPAPPPHPKYPNAIYYCSQESATAFCARSDDGGITFGAGVPIYALTQCGGIHGHVKVAPDGTVYVPNRNCGGKAAVVVSKDNGITWTVQPNPQSSTTGFLVDPSIGIGSNSVGKPAGQTSNTIYLGYQAIDGHPRIAVSHDQGKTWENDQDVGTAFGIQSSTFPEVVAGDDNRAAYAFLGTGVAGNYTDFDHYDQYAVWHLYIATTFDGGVTWTTVDATPNDPVQRGSICNLGTVDCDHSPNDRNLLDFMDATVDAQGRTLVGYPDGCLGNCVNNPSGTYPNSYTARASIARQSGGRRLFAAFDNGSGVTTPASPRVDSVFRDANGVVNVNWSVPDNGGSSITAYNIYRRAADGSYGSALATVPAGTTRFNDATANANTAYLYKITASNAIGEGGSCSEFAIGPPPPTNSCVLPGYLVSTDSIGDQLLAPQNADLDVESVSISEPFQADGVNKLVLTMKVANLSSILPGHQWRMIWTPGTAPLSPATNRYYVGMNANSSATPTITFEYGMVTGNGNAPVILGIPDAGSFDPATGMIQITIANSKVGNPGPGAVLNLISARNFAGNGAASIGKGAAIDYSGDGSYTVVGNGSCPPPNRAPTAALSASPTSGYAPLAVNFDGTGSSDPDAGDSVASYTFDFGDGAVVTQSGATIAHTYNAGGIYTATLTVADTHGGTSTNTAQVQITVNNRPITDCMEDDDARITYSDGWHNGTSINASAGHFRWHQGKSPSHTAAVDFSVPANGTGDFSYRYAKSTKGGTAEVFIDGVSRGTINYKSSAGSDKSPEFASGGVAYEARYESLGTGAHRFELRNMADSVFIDVFCLTVTVAPQPVANGGSSGATTTQSSFTGSPAAGPGQTTSNDLSVNAGQESKSNVSLGTNARALSIVVETSGNLPVKLALVSPTGLTLQIVDAVNGVAVLTTPVTQGGIYTVKVINVNLGPVQVWTVVTPTVAR